jgi:ATPase
MENEKVKNMTRADAIVPDTSILVQGKLSDLVKQGKINPKRIIIPRAVLDELQAQASRGREIGFDGLEEIKRIREVTKGRIKIEFSGERPTLEEIQLAKKGRIDALIRDVASKVGATLITSDYVQALVGEAENVSVEYVERDSLKRPLELESFFSEGVQSLHLKAGITPYVKKGKPGSVELIKLKAKPFSEKELESIIDNIVTRARKEEDSFIEIGKRGALVIQLGNYRISITRPPFSDRIEITAVRPIVKLTLKDYNMHKELENMIVSGYQGIMIAGPPGSGKSTFAASIADFLVDKNKIVKTFEQPRDLQVGPEVTQYAPLEGDWEKTAELLLLVRPDYTIFDEIRRTKDFRVFSDMRLAGVGMIGVTHSTDPVSAIQRFIGRLELGTIPHVIDTVIYINSGRIEKVYRLCLTVKVPTGMKEADLARPVVEIRDFETKALEYEIYTYGEETVIMPVKKEKSPLKELAKERVMQIMQKWDPDADVDIQDNRITARVKSSEIARLIGKKGKNIEELEKMLGMSISVEPREGSLKQEAYWDYEETGAFVNLLLEPGLTGIQVDIYRGEDYLFSAHVGKNGLIRVRKKSNLGRKLLQAVARKNLRILM